MEVVKKRKNNWNSLLPRSGLNPGFLPDKGQAGVDSFNHMNATDFAGGEACCEDLTKLDEAAFNDKTPSQAVRSCLSSDIVTMMNSIVKHNKENPEDKKKILNSDYNEILDTTNNNYLDKELFPTTESIIFRSNISGTNNDKTGDAEKQSKIQHHVLGIHPRSYKTGDYATNYTIFLSPQEHTRLHNNAFDGSVTSIDNELTKKYLDGIKELNIKLTEASNAKEAADIFMRKIQLKAWYIREAWKPVVNSNIDTTINRGYQKELDSELAKILVKHPTYIKAQDIEPIYIGDKQYYVLINDIANIQSIDFNDYIIGNKLVKYPKKLAVDFICAVPVDGSNPGYDNYNDFKKAFPNLAENLNEDVEQQELRKINTDNLRNYLEHNLSKNVIRHNNIILDLISRYMTPDLKKEMFGDKGYISDDEKLETIWRSTKAKKLKQLIIAQYVRYLLSQSNYNNIEIWSKVQPELDENDLLYKLKPEDIIIKYSNH